VLARVGAPRNGRDSVGVATRRGRDGDGNGNAVSDVVAPGRGAGTLPAGSSSAGRWWAVGISAPEWYCGLRGASTAKVGSCPAGIGERGASAAKAGSCLLFDGDGGEVMAGCDVCVVRSRGIEGSVMVEEKKVERSWKDAEESSVR
jgi:hypothetical protein